MRGAQLLYVVAVLAKTIPQSPHSRSSAPDYSQCVPGTASSPPVNTPPPSSTPTPTTTGSHSSATSSTPTTTSTGATPTGSQIRADQDPVYHLYLQNQGESHHFDLAVAALSNDRIETAVTQTVRLYWVPNRLPATSQSTALSH